MRIIAQTKKHTKLFNSIKEASEFLKRSESIIKERIQDGGKVTGGASAYYVDELYEGEQDET